MRSNFQTEKNWWFFFSKPTLNNSILQVSNALLITRHWTNVVIKVSCIYFLIVKEQSVSRMKNVLLHAHMSLKKAHHSSREDFFFLDGNPQSNFKFNGTFYGDTHKLGKSKVLRVGNYTFCDPFIQNILHTKLATIQDYEHHLKISIALWPAMLRIGHDFRK